MQSFMSYFPEEPKNKDRRSNIQKSQDLKIKERRGKGERERWIKRHCAEENRMGGRKEGGEEKKEKKDEIALRSSTIRFTVHSFDPKTSPLSTNYSLTLSLLSSSTGNKRARIEIPSRNWRACNPFAFLINPFSTQHQLLPSLSHHPFTLETW